jgi:hypothetical protein
MRKNSSRCVVATAIARAFPKASRIQVDVYGIKFTIGDRRHTYLTPPKIHEYIVAFDAGDTLHPFRFTLDDNARVTHRRNTFTDHGKEVHKARTLAASRAKKAEKVAADPAASEAQRTVAREEAAAAAAQRRAVEAKASLAPQRQTEKIPETEVPKAQQVSGRTNPRVFRRGKERAYGARVLRVNNDPGPGDFRGPLDTE